MSVAADRRPRLRPRAALPAAGATIVPLIATAASLVLFAVGLPGVDLSKLGDLGLAALLPPTTWAALAILTTSFVLLLRSERPPVALCLLHVGSLIVMLYGLPALLEPVARMNAAWRHTGIAQYILDRGALNPQIDAYFNWPGFFLVLGFVSKIAGVSSPIAIAAWAPTVFNALFAAPLWVIARSATADRRLAWLTLWIFYTTNWISQDYMAPQAMTYLLFLVVVALALRWLQPADDPEPGWLGRRIEAVLQRLRLSRYVRSARRDESVPELSTRQRVLVLALVIAAFGAIVPSHQLMPIATLGVFILLAFAGRISTRSLPLLFGLMISAWLIYMTVAFLNGHLDQLTNGVGNVDATVQSNVGNRVGGTPGHLLVVYLRLALTSGLWVLAAIGMVIRRRAGYRDDALVLAAIAPFPLLILQPYGGEMLLRVAFFALPFMSFFAAATILGGVRLFAGRLEVAVRVLVLVPIVVFMLFARYGNEKAESFTNGEVAVVRQFYDVALPNSLVYTGVSTGPVRYRDYDLYSFRAIQELPEWTTTSTSTGQLKPLIDDIYKNMSARPGGAAYVMILRSQEAFSDIFSGQPPGTLAKLADALSSDGRFRVLYQVQDGILLGLAGTAGGGA
jgi:hypothetical protein